MDTETGTKAAPTAQELMDLSSRIEKADAKHSPGRGSSLEGWRKAGAFTLALAASTYFVPADDRGTVILGLFGLFVGGNAVEHYTRKR